MRSFVTYSNIYPTRCKVTQFILSGNCSTYFGWYHHPSSGAQTTISTASGICHTVTATYPYRSNSFTIAAGSSNSVTYTKFCSTVVCAPDDGWWYHLKHVEKFPDKINCVKLYLVAYILEYYYDALIHER